MGADAQNPGTPRRTLSNETSARLVGGSFIPGYTIYAETTHRSWRIWLNHPLLPRWRRSQGAITRRYHARNQQIVDAADEVFALVAPDRRGGTEDTMRRAERKGIRVTIL
jgi:hypothetical protein